MSGSRLTLARKLRGMSQTALAKEVGVTPRAISKYEKEGEGISDMTLAAIADASASTPRSSRFLTSICQNPQRCHFALVQKCPRKTGIRHLP